MVNSVEGRGEVEKNKHCGVAVIDSHLYWYYVR